MGGVAPVHIPFLSPSQIASSRKPSLTSSDTWLCRYMEVQVCSLTVQLQGVSIWLLTHWEHPHGCIPTAQPRAWLTGGAQYMFGDEGA